VESQSRIRGRVSSISLQGCLLAPERGQGLMEYGLILAMVSIFCIVALFAVGDQLGSVLTKAHDLMFNCVTHSSC
jgi:Flp pilus assembly pilin Flp